MKRLFYFLFILNLTACDSISPDNDCYTCKIYIYNPTTGNKISDAEEEVCGGQKKADEYRDNNKGVKNGIGKQITCTKK